MNENLTMKFDKNTIDHLGIKLYSSFPPVVAELISNSYDADAEIVYVTIDYEKKQVVVEDDGTGMTFSELNNEFLVVGRNRRIQNKSDTSLKKQRKVTGKKGVGKLAVFGIAEDITVSSIKSGQFNEFKMNYHDIKNCPTSEYSPQIIEKNTKTTATQGTTIKIDNIKQKRITDIYELSISLSKRFKFYDENDFMVVLKNENTKEEIVMNNSIFFDDLVSEFSWKFPDDFINETDENIQKLVEYGITGEIYTQPTPLKKKDTGFIVYSRGKLVQENSFFSSRSNDHFNSYVTGYFEVDYIDNLYDDDFVSTDRRSILWEQNDDLIEIREAFNTLVNKIQMQWRKKREQKKEDKIQNDLPSDFYEDIESEADKMALKSLEKNLIKNSTAQDDTDSAISILKSVKNQFKFESFKNKIIALNEVEITIENMQKISQDWENIETQELAKIAIGRIQTIERFENFVNNNSSETKVIQPFLEKFPWILEPRMTHFDREVTFKKILQEAFPDETLEESNRRIDFLCSNINGDIIIIELKRPQIKISQKEILQALDYESFIRQKRANLKDIKTILISDRHDMDPSTKHLYDNLKNSSFEIKTYTEMLDQAKTYHKQFTEALESIEEAKSEVK
ncbi:ATP-binding protein [Listeria monocytogenes]|nr:ATP-binding protein [Listeria monocytogenes]